MPVTGFTVELRTERFGTWYLADLVFLVPEEAARYVDELSHTWAGLVQDWRIIETMRRPTHTWSPYSGLTPIFRPPSDREEPPPEK